MKRIALPLLLAASTVSYAGGKPDVGVQVERLLTEQSKILFGVKKPLSSAATEMNYVAREWASADQRILLAKGLKAEYVTRNVALSADMIAFYPNAENYSHLMVCIELGRSGKTPAGNDGMNAAVQRVNVNTGGVETILYGMSRCDGIRTTAWGTVLVTEETTDGRAYEIIDPLTTTREWVADRSSGDIRSAIDSTTASSKIVQRIHLPTMAWEGLEVLDSGVVYAGDELRPGSNALDTDGGAIFKFLPDSPRTDDAMIESLDQSPLAMGSTYALSVSCRESSSSSFPQYGQGCEVGHASWVKVDPLNARSDANNRGATGYYRPEDLHLDVSYDGAGERFCWANTGREKANNYGEINCAVDYMPVPANPSLLTHDKTGFIYLGNDVDYTVASVNRFIEGDSRFNSYDNLAFQPTTNNLYVIEDHKYGEVIACLPDGADRNIKSDGCIGIASVIDPAAEPTGFIFDASGEVAYVIIQHGEQADSLLDFTSNPVDGRTDDLIKITGFQLKNSHYHHEVFLRKH